MSLRFFSGKICYSVNDVPGFRPTSCAGGHHNKENNQKAVANRQDDQKLIERWSLAFSQNCQSQKVSTQSQKSDSNQ